MHSYLVQLNYATSLKAFPLVVEPTVANLDYCEKHIYQQSVRIHLKTVFTKTILKSLQAFVVLH